jgi:glycogen operon protein
MIAEAWDAAGLYQVANFTGDRWAVWNGRFRDTVRRFLRGDRNSTTALGDALVGSAGFFNRPLRDPLRGVNFITAHDGFTLNDLVSYDNKHNEANGEKNGDGANDNNSWNCGVEGPTEDPAINALRRRQLRNFVTILLLSQGRPMLLMGDEIRRTQRGNNNSYCQDNELSRLDWGNIERRGDLRRFVAGLIGFHERSSMFRDRRFWGHPGSAAVTWHGVRLNQPDWGEDSHSLAIELVQPESQEHLHVMLNAYWEALSFDLPALPPGRQWNRLVHTALPDGQDISEPPSPLAAGEHQYRVEPRSAAVLVAGPAPDRA